MKKEFILIAVAAGLVGCNVGNAPETLKPEEVQAAVDKAAPQDQIDWVNRSPLPPAEKEKRIAEIKAKAGMK